MKKACYLPIYYVSKGRRYTTKCPFILRKKCKTDLYIEKETGFVLYKDYRNNEMSYYMPGNKHCLLINGELVTES